MGTKSEMSVEVLLLKVATSKDVYSYGSSGMKQAVSEIVFPFLELRI